MPQLTRQPQELQTHGDGAGPGPWSSRVPAGEEGEEEGEGGVGRKVWPDTAATGTPLEPGLDAEEEEEEEGAGRQE